jgi:isocitrate/isopropylmalate dehydrogenase
MVAGSMMLERLGQKERGVRLEAAVRRAIAKGKDLTPDLGGTGTTGTFTDRVIGEIESNPAPAL